MHLTAYGMYGYLVEAQKRYHKKTALTNLDIAHEQVRMLWRLAFELGYLGFKDGRRDGVTVRRQCQSLAMPSAPIAVVIYCVQRNGLTRT